MPRIISAAAVVAMVLLASGNVTAVATATQPSRSASLVAASATEIKAPPDDQVVELADRAMRLFMASVREKHAGALEPYFAALSGEILSRPTR